MPVARITSGRTRDRVALYFEGRRCIEAIHIPQELQNLSGVSFRCFPGRAHGQHRGYSSPCHEQLLLRTTVAAQPAS